MAYLGTPSVSVIGEGIAAVDGCSGEPHRCSRIWVLVFSLTTSVNCHLDLGRPDVIADYERHRNGILKSIKRRPRHCDAKRELTVPNGPNLCGDFIGSYRPRENVTTPA